MYPGERALSNLGPNVLVYRSVCISSDLGGGEQFDVGGAFELFQVVV